MQCIAEMTRCSELSRRETLIGGSMIVEDLSRATTSKVAEGSLKSGIPEARKVFLIPPLLSVSPSLVMQVDSLCSRLVH